MAGPCGSCGTVCAPERQTLVRFDGNATQTASNVPAGAAANVMTVPYANVTVCAYPAVGSPCTNTVQVYSDQAGAQPISYPLQTDGKGRFGFWVSPGTYSYSVVSGKGVTIGDSPFTVGGGGGGEPHRLDLIPSSVKGELFNLRQNRRICR
jgi:hypothetical protein